MLFQAFTFTKSRGSYFEHQVVKQSVQTSSERDLATVNARKQTCVTVILAYLPASNQKPTENTNYTLK